MPLVGIVWQEAALKLNEVAVVLNCEPSAGLKLPIDHRARICSGYGILHYVGQNEFAVKAEVV